MKTKFISLVVLSFIYSQCDNLNELNCISNHNCEWVQEEYGNCEDIINSFDCGEIEECSWWSGCHGGTYLINSSYCQESEEESEVLQCSEMEETECGANGNCNWIVDIQYGSCSNLGSSSCDATPGCWGAYQYPGWYSGWYCAGGTYIISDNSYCEEINISECSDMNELECNSDNACDWTINESFADCDDFYNEAQCATYPDECIWEENIVNNSCANLSQSECSQYDGCVWDCSWWYSWACWCIGSWESYNNECTGEYSIEEGVCEESIYELGDFNQDGIINIQDIIRIINLIYIGEYNYLADSNEDGEVNIVDVVLIVNLILNV